MGNSKLMVPLFYERGEWIEALRESGGNEAVSEAVAEERKEIERLGSEPARQTEYIRNFLGDHGSTYYDKAVEQCQKKRHRKQHDSDVVGEAMAMAYLQVQRVAAAKDKSRSAHASGLSEETAGAAITVVQVEHYDIFEDDVIILWGDVSNVPQAIQANVRQIDADRFDPNCFAVCVNYDFEQHQLAAGTAPHGPET